MERDNVKGTVMYNGHYPKSRKDTGGVREEKSMDSQENGVGELW